MYYIHLFRRKKATWTLKNEKGTGQPSTFSPNCDAIPGVKSIIFHPPADLQRPPPRFAKLIFFWAERNSFKKSPIFRNSQPNKITFSQFFKNKKVPPPPTNKKTSQLGGPKHHNSEGTQRSPISSWDTSEASELPPALGSCGKQHSRASKPRRPTLPKHPLKKSPENMPNKLQGYTVILIAGFCPKTHLSHSIIFVKISSDFAIWAPSFGYQLPLWLIPPPHSSKTLRAVWESPAGVDGSTFTLTNWPGLEPSAERACCIYWCW